jgi:galactokinase
VLVSAAGFRSCYGREAEVAWRAPGRVNLIGEHTDYNGGLVLPFAIVRSVEVAAAARTDRVVEFCSRQAPADPVVADLGAIAPGVVPGWAAYAAGVVYGLREAGQLTRGVSLFVDSDLPQGAGLASSAALECAVAGCLSDLAGIELSRPDLALAAWRAENEFVGVPCGIMDQTAVMLCKPGHALLLDCRTGESQDVPLDPGGAGLRLMVIDTGVRHELAGGEYAARRRECEQAASGLGVSSLREAGGHSFAVAPGTGARFDVLDDPVLRRRARHVVSENARVEQAVELMGEGRLADCGSLLTESHQSLRDDFEVSWPEADLAVEAALRAGVLGARMTGAGFGGCVLALARHDASAAVGDAVRAAFAEAALGEPGFVDADPGGGAERLIRR